MDDWQRAKARGVLIIRWVLAAIFIAASYVIYKQHEATKAQRQAALDTRNYLAAIRVLESEENPPNIDSIYQVFLELAARGDVRGNFGLACVLYKRQPGARDEAISNLRIAADADFLPAKAALISRYVAYTDRVENAAKDQESAQQLLFQLLEAAEKGRYSRTRDPTMPDPPTGTITKDSTSYVWNVLEKGVCARALDNEKIISILQNANPLTIRPVLRRTGP